MSGFELDAYLTRIGLSRPPPATTDGLITLTGAQVQRIVFENVDPYLGRAIRLDELSLVQKLIHRNRGGYCFELNSLLSMALSGLGFKVRPHLARVVNEAGEPGRRTHLLLEIEAGSRHWLADCGFGRRGPRQAIPLEAGRIDIQNGEAFRLIRHERWHWILETRIDGWQPLYSFGDASFQPVDIEMANFYTNMWPLQRFRTDLVAARATPTGRLTFLNGTFKEIINGVTTELELTTIEEVARALVGSFDLPEAELDLPALAGRLDLA